MSAIVKYTVDALGFVPNLWGIYEQESYGWLRCIRVERTSGRVHITAEILPRNWRAK